MTRHDLACVLTRSGQSEEALSLLRQAVDHGLASRIACGIEKAPYFHSLQGDPCFTAELARAKEHATALSRRRK